MLSATRTSRSWPSALHRLLHSAALSQTSRLAGIHRRTTTRIALLSCGIIGGSLYIRHSTIHADADVGENLPRRPTSFSTLLRSYIVYSLCSFPVLVDYSPPVFTALISIPGLRQLTESLVRSTFFAQFVGGDRAEATVPIMTRLRQDNKGVLLAYSVEVDQEEAEGKSLKLATDRTSAKHRQNVDEVIKSIDVAADFEDRLYFDRKSGPGRKTWVAVKLTALLPSATSLINLSNHLCQSRPPSSPPVPYPGCPHHSDLDFIESGAPPPPILSEADVNSLKQLYYDLNRIAQRGQQRGVRIIVDAEYSRYQPAIDAFTMSLMRRFNVSPKSTGIIDERAVQPLVYATYQAYLKRSLSHLVAGIADAKAGGYALGVKLVRGAYHSFEVEASHSLEVCPVWTTKMDTDACYNQCVRLLLSALKSDIPHKIPRLGILFGTHNSRSCAEILSGLVREGIATESDGRIVVGEAAAERCVIGQLFGMSDALTNSLVDKVRSPSPFVIKYVPYGSLSAVMPYLSRRAIENKSVLFGEGGAAAERRRAGAEIRRRLLEFLL